MHKLYMHRHIIFLASLLKFDPRFYCIHKQTVERKQMLRKLQLKIVRDDSQCVVWTISFSLHTQHNPPLQNSLNWQGRHHLKKKKKPKTHQVI